MQHQDEKRKATQERVKRRREEHLIWKAVMFPSRPPPPPLPIVDEGEEEQDDDRINRRGGPTFSICPSLVAKLVRHHQLGGPCSTSSLPVAPLGSCDAQQPSSSTLREDPTTVCGSSNRNTAGRPWSPLELKLKDELLSRQPFADGKRTPKPDCTMAVLRLSPDATEEDLRRFGELYGHVVMVRVVRDVATGASRRYGFVQYSYTRELDRALRTCNDPASPRPRIAGKIVICEPEKSRTDALHVPARLTVVRDKLKKNVQPSSSSSHVDPSEPLESTTTTSSSVLDNIDDYLAALM